MKKFFSIIFFAALCASLFVGEPAGAAVSFIGLVWSLTEFKSSKRGNYAMLTLVPAYMIDALGNPIPPFTRAQKFLFDYLNMKGNDITKKALNEGTLIWDPITYFIRAAITGLSGRQKIASQATSLAVGVTNLDKWVLPQYYNFCYDRIAVRYTTTTVSATDAVYSGAGYSSVLSSMAPGLRNGNLIVSMNQNIMLYSPVIDYGSQASVTGGGVRDFDGGELQTPQIFVENQNLTVELEFPVVIPSATNTSYFVEVAFSGIQARIR